ncbi:MAG TPA: acyl-CoA dehydrogenase family protein, partial [Gaiellales bacterium]|nr:acyl-CoA dehydrogenase family protein [Gaiellales bacterium]
MSSDEREMLIEAVRTLARERVAPRAAAIDHAAEFPWDMVELLREHEVFALAFPAELGGTGTGTLTHLRAVEELSYADASVGLVLAVQGLGGLPVLLAGSELQRRTYVPRWASGEWIAAYALTESEAGSDAQALRTSARRDGPDWVLDGGKRFITNAGVATTYTVFARSQAGISAFLVHADDPGFSVVRIEPKMGIKGSTTGELALDSCRIPGDRLVGGEGDGFRLAMRVLDRSRPGIAAQALGIGRAALDHAARYATQRVAFGRPIA